MHLCVAGARECLYMNGSPHLQAVLASAKGPLALDLAREQPVELSIFTT